MFGIKIFDILVPSDRERYDTTIGIPTNLPDGFYVLQAAMIVGNGGIYNSCAKLKIKGGNPTFNCKSNKEPVKYQCSKGAGKPFSSLEKGMWIIKNLLALQKIRKLVQYADYYQKLRFESKSNE